MSMQCLEITIGIVATTALALDDSEMQRAMNVEVTWRKTLAKITGAPADLAIVLDDLYSRSSPDGGWDQSKDWEVACKRAFASAQKQVERAGYRVAIERRAGVARVTIRLGTS